MTLKATNDNVASLAATKLTGAMPAVDGSALTGLTTLRQVVKSASDPTVSTNPTDGVGEIWCNTTNIIESSNSFNNSK